MKNSFFVIIFFSLFIIFGCSNNVLESHPVTDSYYDIREIAWKFVHENGWYTTAIGNWEEANVKTILINNDYELFDASYQGKEALAVSFEDQENVVAGTPVILVDPTTKKVIGYMPSE